MRVTNHVLQAKYGVSLTVRQLIARMMLQKEIMFQLKYQDVHVQAGEYQNAKTQSKKLRVFEIADAFDAVMLRLSKAKIATSTKQTKSIPILEKAFAELSKVLKLIDNPPSIYKIQEEHDRVFDELYSIDDILKGNTMEMHKEARKIAVKNLYKAGS